MRTILFPILPVLLFLLSCKKNPTEYQSNSISNLLLQSEKLLYAEPDSAKGLLERAYSKSVETNDTAFLARAFHLWGMLDLMFGEIENGIKKLEKSNQFAKEINNLHLYSKNLIELGEAHYNLGRYDYSLNFFLEAKQISKQHKYQDIESLSLLKTGKYYHSVGKFDESINYYLKAIEIARKTGDKELIADNLNNIGKHYETVGAYSKALEAYLEALDLSHFTHNHIIKASTYNHLGNIYLEIGNYEEAKQYTLSSLQVRKTLHYDEGQAKSYKNLGEIYEQMGKNDSAVIFYNKSLKICERINYKKGIIKATTNLGRIYLKTKNYALAEQNLTESLQLCLETGYEKGMINALLNLGLIKQDIDLDNEALEYLQEAYNLSISKNIKKIASPASNAIASIYEKRNNQAKALEYYKRHIALEEELINDEKTKYIAEIQLGYELEKKDKEKQLLLKENELKVLAINRQRAIIVMTSIILLLLSLVIVINYNRLNNRRKANAQLTLLNNEITDKNKLLVQLNKDLSIAVREKDKFFSIIAHELRNPLWWFRNLAETLSTRFDKLESSKVRKGLQSLDESAKTAFHLTDNLLYWSRKQLGILPFEPQDVNLYTIIENNIKLIKSIAEYKNIDIWNQVSRDKTITADPNLLDTVVRNILSNAIKFTENNGFIIIQTQVFTDRIEITLTDNGKGMSNETLNKLNSNKSVNSSTGTMNEKGSGLGLILAKEFIQQHNGKVEFKSKPGVGTSVKILLPQNEKINAQPSVAQNNSTINVPNFNHINH